MQNLRFRYSNHTLSDFVAILVKELHIACGLVCGPAFKVYHNREVLPDYLRELVHFRRCFVYLYVELLHF